MNRQVRRAAEIVAVLLFVVFYRYPGGWLGWWGLLFVVPLCDLLVNWWKKRISKSWPATTGTIEFGAVHPVWKKRSPTKYALDLSYSYRVSGETFGGVGMFYKTYDTEVDATLALRSIQRASVTIRYHPDKPSRSALEP